MFVWAKLPVGAPDSETYVDQLLYGKDLFIAPGTIFGSRGEGYVRFSLCVKEELIMEAGRRI
jgi:aspartate/methionine/tyrosine aminotransferase